MALVCLYDPYEWIDPEKGRQGVIVHTSQIGGRERFIVAQIEERPTIKTWPEIWEKFDDRSKRDP